MATQRLAFAKVAAATCVLACMLAACDNPFAGQNTNTQTSTAGTSAEGSAAASGVSSTGDSTSAIAGTDQATSATLSGSESSSQAATSSDGQKCQNLTGQQALEKHLAQVPRPFPADYDPAENHWSLNSPTDTYDPCAELSWILLKIDRGTASSPHQVMLFHNGVYVTRATDQPFAFEPYRIWLGEDDDVFIEFRYALEGQSTADASGSVTARYSWNEDYQYLDRFGDVPPGAGWVQY